MASKIYASSDKKANVAKVKQRRNTVKMSGFEPLIWKPSQPFYLLRSAFRFLVIKLKNESQIWMQAEVLAMFRRLGPD